MYSPFWFISADYRLGQKTYKQSIKSLVLVYTEIALLSKRRQVRAKKDRQEEVSGLASSTGVAWTLTFWKSRREFLFVILDIPTSWLVTLRVY
jgi:hypothetical protein